MSDVLIFELGVAKVSKEGTPRRGDSISMRDLEDHGESSLKAEVMWFKN
jgi:hypothetical protein